MTPPFKCKSKDLIVISDFDRTLTKAYVNNRFVFSVKSILRTENILGNEYSKMDSALADRYTPIENNPLLSNAEKLKQISEWRKQSIDLMLRCGLLKSNLRELGHSSLIQFKDNAKTLFKLLDQKGIPLVVVSASGVGEAIPYIFEFQDMKFDNQTFVINEFIWNKDENVIGIKQPVLNGVNKGDIKLDERLPSGLLNRKNVIILGDSLDDVKVIENSKYKHIFSVGFLLEGTQKAIEEYSKVYDMLILNDGPMDKVIELIKSITD